MSAKRTEDEEPIDEDEARDESLSWDRYECSE